MCAYCLLFVPKIFMLADAKHAYAFNTPVCRYDVQRYLQSDFFFGLWLPLLRHMLLYARIYAAF